MATGGSITHTTTGTTTPMSTSRTAKAKRVNCCVCDKTIIEGKQGQEAIQCDDCDQWLHRECSGLSRSMFNVMTSTDCPFYCFMCCMSSLKSLRSTVDIQRSVISELQHTVENLSTALTALEASMASFVKNEKEKEKDKEKDIQFPELSVTAQLNQPISSSPSKSKTEDGRKFNLVLHGIPELPSGTRYYDRLEKDHEEVVSLFESADVSLPPSSMPPPW